MAGTSYTRQSTFADGDTITAALFNDEYNQLVNAFSYTTTGTTGHQHDGSAGQGGNIGTIGDQDFLNKIVVDSTNNRWGVYIEVGGVATEQVRIQDGAIVPVTDDDIDLGTSSLEFKDLYLDGTANIDSLVADTADINAGTIDGTTIGATSASTGAFTTLTASGATTLSGALSVEGNTTLGNAATDTVTFTADIASNLLPSADSTYDLGDGSTYWANAYIDAVTTTGNVSIGGNLTVTGNATIAGNLTFGDAATDTVAFSADVASNLLPSADGTYSLGAVGSEWQDLYIDGTANIDSLVADTADINGGTIDNAAIGSTTASTGNFSTLSLSGTAITATAAELNLLDGVTATTTEINYLDGVTSNIQTQLDALQSSDADLTAIAALSNADGNFIVGNGTTWVAESGATARTSLGLGSLATASTISNDNWSGTDLEVANGGTGASSASAARTNLGVAIGSDVLAYDSNLQSFVTTFTLPTTDGTSGQALITDAAGTISFGDVDSLPTQTGNSGYYLTTDGTNASWDNLKASPTFTGTVTFSGTEAITVPVGTTAQRPTAAQGMIRFNTTDTVFEGYDGSSWGSIGAQFAYTRTSATATASQTTFSATYTAGYVDVYLNGVKLISGTDFTATNGTSVVLTSGAAAGDLVEILAYETFQVANALIASNNLSDLSSVSTARTNLGLAIGTDVQAYDAQLADVAGLTPTDGNIIIGNGTNFITESGATARASLGLTIGTDVQAYDAQLADVAGLTPTDGNIIIGNGTNFITESGSTARTSLGVAIGTDVQAYDSNLTSFVGTFTLPTSDGTADQVLKTDGSGTLGFTTVSAGPTNTSNVGMSGVTKVEFTSIPSGVSHIWVNVIQCSTANSNVRTGIELGTSSGFVTSGYNSSGGWYRGGGGGAGEQDSADEATMLMFFYNDGNNRYYSGSVHLAKLADNKWVMSSVGGTDQTSAQIYSGVGDITLSAELTQLKVTTNSGNFDDGQVNISYM